MEFIAPFELSQLQRDWIRSDCGGDFAGQLSQALQQIQAQPAAVQRGVLIAEREPLAAAAAFFAAVYLGAPVAWANPNWGAQEWQQLEALLNPALVFGTARVATVPRSLAVTPPQRGQILIPTGGSSGGVKLAVHCWASLAAAAHSFQQLIGAGPVDSFCVLPLYHVSGLLPLLRSFCSGGRITFGSVEQLPAQAHSLCFSLVPTQLQRLLDSPSQPAGLLAARAIFIGGAPMAPELAARARELRLPIVLSYGMTETAAMVAAIPSADFLAQPKLPAAPALPGVALQIVAEDGRPCAPGQVGRIRIESASLFQGYHGQAPLDLSQGYLTDDLGQLDELGRLTVLRRRDALIVSGGEKIDPREVERALLATGLARAARVVGAADSEWGQQVVALYVPAQDAPLDPTDWVERLRPQLANYKIPKLFIPLQSLPFDEKGKLTAACIESIITNYLEQNEATDG